MDIMTVLKDGQLTQFHFIPRMMDTTTDTCSSLCQSSVNHNLRQIQPGACELSWAGHPNYRQVATKTTHTQQLALPKQINDKYNMRLYIFMYSFTLSFLAIFFYK